MVQCAVFGCNKNNNKKLKRSENNPNGEVNHFYRFPKDESMCQLWVTKCYRNDKFKVENARICQEHFQSNDFVRNLKHELLNYHPTTIRKLKKEAFPNQNLPNKNVESKTSKERESRIAGRNKKKIVTDLIKEAKFQENIDLTKENEFSFQDSDVCDTEAQSKTLNVPDEKSKNKAKVMKMKIMKLIRENNILKLSNKSFKISHKNLKRQHKKMNMKINNLKKENSLFSTEQREIQKIFTAGQIRKIKNPSKIISKWSGNDIAKAISLHAAGARAYRFLLKNNYPLPAESTLRRWASRIKIESSRN